MPSIRCRVVTPMGLAFEGEAASIRAPGYEGGFGVLPKHAPLLAQLGEGRLVLKDEAKAEVFGLDVEGGFFLVARDECTVLVERATEAGG